MPVYCETFLGPTGAFPAEPVNAATSFVPVALGLLALWFLYRRRETSWVAYALAVLTVLTGMGSVLWHAYRTETFLILDALPGVVYFFLLLVFWFARLRGLYPGLALLGGALALTIFGPEIPRLWGQIAGVAFLVAVAAGLLIATWYRRRPAFGAASAMVGAAMLALVMRSIDLRLCSEIPVGTHFFWHVFLGLAAYAGVRMAVLMRDDPTAEEVRG